VWPHGSVAELYNTDLASNLEHERLDLAGSAAVEIDWACSTEAAQGDTTSGAHACDASTRIHLVSLTIPQFVQLMQQLPVDQYLRLRWSCLHFFPPDCRSARRRKGTLVPEICVGVKTLFHGIGGSWMSRSINFARVRLLWPPRDRSRIYRSNHWQRQLIC